ncbi:hypothetical protein TNIN_121111, partial [Trichonephila inaurata madagascariensis]
CDLPPEGPVANPASMDEFCKEKGFSGWFLTSAKDNVNVDEAARFLVRKILESQDSIVADETSNDTTVLTEYPLPIGQPARKKLCC